MNDAGPPAGGDATTITLSVSTEAAGMRLDAYLAGLAELGQSRSAIQRLIEDGQVRVDARPARASLKVQPGQSIQVVLPPPAPATAQPEDIPLPIVYEDADLVVVDKPRGLVVHPAAGHAGGTLVNALLHHVDDLSGIGGELRPGIVHRLDKDTTGLLVVAKNDAAHRSLAGQIKARTAGREYLALVHGLPETDQGVIDAPIGRHPTQRKRMSVRADGGRPARTHFRVRERFPVKGAAAGGFSLLLCRLETGRTHQVRVHLASIGHPVVADPTYGPGRPAFGLEGQALHAFRLSLTHPRTGEPLVFESPLPPDFEAALNELRSRAVAR